MVWKAIFHHLVCRFKDNWTVWLLGKLVDYHSNYRDIKINVTKVGPKILKAGVPKMSTNVSQIIHARKIHLSGASIHLEVSGVDLVLKDILAMDFSAMILTNV